MVVVVGVVSYVWASILLTEKHYGESSIIINYVVLSIRSAGLWKVIRV